MSRRQTNNKKSVSETETTEITNRSIPNAIGLNIVRTQVESGPLPPPEKLAEYEKIRPGITDVLIDLIKEQMKHRHQCELKELDLREKEIDKENNEIGMKAKASSFWFSLSSKGQISITAWIAFLLIAICVCAYSDKDVIAYVLCAVLVITISINIIGSVFKVVKEQRN